MATVGGIDGDLCRHSRVRGPRRQRRDRLAGLRDLLQRRDHGRRRAAAGLAGAATAIDSCSISIASRAAIDAQHADADRQQPVESDRMGDHRGGTARARGDRRAATTSSSWRTKSTSGWSMTDATASRRRSRASSPNRDRLIVVNSFSKTYNMTGWRLGWAQSSERDHQDDVQGGRVHDVESGRDGAAGRHRRAPRRRAVHRGTARRTTRSGARR